MFIQIDTDIIKKIDDWGLALFFGNLVNIYPVAKVASIQNNIEYKLMTTSYILKNISGESSCSRQRVYRYIKQLEELGFLTTYRPSCSEVYVHIDSQYLIKPAYEKANSENGLVSKKPIRTYPISSYNIDNISQKISGGKVGKAF